MHEKRSRSFWLYVLLSGNLIAMLLLVVWLGKGFDAVAALFSPRFQRYQGENYVLNYPEKWTVQENHTAVIFCDEITNAQMIVEVMSSLTNPEPLPDETQASVVTQKSLQYYENITIHAQEPPVASPIRFAGTTWSQRALRGEMNVHGKVQQTHMLFLANNQPTLQRTLPTIAIIYSVREELFEQMNRDIFKPVLKSFTFQTT